MEFSTYDADHDKKKDLNCAAYGKGAFWWGEYCGPQNINGPYDGSYWEWPQIIMWGDHHFLNETQMMIRPAP